MTPSSGEADAVIFALTLGVTKTLQRRFINVALNYWNRSRTEWDPACNPNGYTK